MADRSEMKFTPDDPKPGDGDKPVEDLKKAQANNLVSTEGTLGRNQIELAMAETPKVDRQGNQIE